LTFERDCVPSYSPPQLSTTNGFLARHRTDPTSIFLQIKVIIDNILCIMCVFYQLLMILLYFNFLTVIFISLAAAELHSAGNARINEYGSFVELKYSEENLGAIFRHFRKIAKSDYYLHRVRPYETTCLGWTDFHEIWYMSFCRKCVQKIQVYLTL